MQQLIYRYVCGKSDAVCVCFTESDNDEKMFTTSVFGEECKLVIGTKLMLIPIDTDVATLRDMMLLVLGEYAEKTDNKAMTEAYWRVVKPRSPPGWSGNMTAAAGRSTAVSI